VIVSTGICTLVVEHACKSPRVPLRAESDTQLDKPPAACYYNNRSCSEANMYPYIIIGHTDSVSQQ